VKKKIKQGSALLILLKILLRRVLLY